MESSTIKMTIDTWEKTTKEQRSPVVRINGFPWQLKVWAGFESTKGGKWSRKALPEPPRDPQKELRQLSLVCLMADHAELWECTVRIREPTIYHDLYALASWDRGNFEIPVDKGEYEEGTKLEVKIEVHGDGKEWRLCPVLFMSDPLDMAFIFPNKKRIKVNRKNLSEQSSYFHALLFGGFREVSMDAIPIKDVGYEEFLNMLSLIYRFANATLTDSNVQRVLQLADRFDLKILEDIAVNFLLSRQCHLTLHEKLCLTEQHKIPLLVEHIYKQYNSMQLTDLANSREVDLISKETLVELITSLHSAAYSV